MEKLDYPLSYALEGYLLYARAEHLSQNTINNYCVAYVRLQQHFAPADPPIASITSHHFLEILAKYPNLKRKTLSNYHIAWSAFYTWCVAEKLVTEHILRSVPRPKPEQRTIEPYTRADLQAMLQSLARSRLYTRPGKKENDHSLPNPARNRAIILLLLDTGLRASELCDLKIAHLDTKNNRVRVYGKGAKERMLPISPRTTHALWKYLSTRSQEPITAPLFLSGDGPFDRHQLRRTLTRIGQRAGLRRVNVHRFRHTFAISFLRNGIKNGGGPNPWALQAALGHTTMEMVRKYLNLLQSDLENVHLIVSPVENWKL